MRNFFAGLALCLLALQVVAQQPRPSCYAAGLGTGTVAKRVPHTAGEGWYHFCVTETSVSTVVTARANGYRLVLPTIDPRAPTKDILDAVWDANARRDCSRNSADAVIGPICRATWLAADADPDRPVLKSWRVAPNPQSTSTPPTRPMWDPTATRYVAERATVDELCDCSRKTQKGSQTLCPLSPFKEPPASANLAACVLK